MVLNKSGVKFYLTQVRMFRYFYQQLRLLKLDSCTVETTTRGSLASLGIICPYQQASTIKPCSFRQVPEDSARRLALILYMQYACSHLAQSRRAKGKANFEASLKKIHEVPEGYRDSDIKVHTKAWQATYLQLKPIADSMPVAQPTHVVEGR